MSFQILSNTFFIFSSLSLFFLSLLMRYMMHSKGRKRHNTILFYYFYYFYFIQWLKLRSISDISPFFFFVLVLKFQKKKLKDQSLTNFVKKINN